MALYNLQNQKLQIIKEDSFKLEKDIQAITEKNLEYIFGLKFIKSEFSLNNLRIDSLAFDNDSKSFVIIEYKRDKNFSVIDQGYAYLSLMLNNKADFILEYNESTNTNLKRDDVDWSQSRVMFVSPAFSKYQQQAINFRDLPIELWEITKYQNDLIQYSRLKSPETSESINKISKSNEIVDKVTEEVKVYTEEDHLKSADEEILSLYEEFKNQILSLDDKIEVIPKKKYIAFKASSNFIDVLPQKGKIKFWLNIPKGELNDPYNVSRDVSEIGHWGNGDYEFILNSSSDFINLMPLIKQSYERNK
jgi:predicted transport protein